MQTVAAQEFRVLEDFGLGLSILGDQATFQANRLGSFGVKGGDRLELNPGSRLGKDNFGKFLVRVQDHLPEIGNNWI